MLAAQQQVFAAQQQAAAQLSPNHFRSGGRNFENIDCDDDDEDVIMTNGNANRLNVMSPELDTNHPESPTSSVPNSNPSLNHSHLSKLGDDENRMPHSSPSLDCHASKTMNSSTPKRCLDIDKSPDNSTVASSNTAKMFHCKYCGISFQDVVLHTIHMGYHGYNDVFTCNNCGEKCADHISFFLHIARNQHT